MTNEKELTKTDYEWVWVVRSVRTNKGETVPMEKGDLLYICAMDADNVRFHHRTKGSTENSGLWNKAAGSFDKEKNTIRGTLPDKTSFEMMLAREGDYHRITCAHVRNPEQGEWDADDEVGR